MFWVFPLSLYDSWAFCFYSWNTFTDYSPLLQLITPWKQKTFLDIFSGYRNGAFGINGGKLNIYEALL